MLGGGILATVLFSAFRAEGTVSVIGYLVCSLLMLAGMFASEWLGPQIAREWGAEWNLSAMVSAMTAGMAGGMMPGILVSGVLAKG